MKCNIAQAKPRAPKEWERLPDRDKHIIIQYLKEKVMEDLEQTLIPDLVKINLDHEEAELQKVWIKLMVIANHQEHGHGEVRARRTLRRWKRLYAKIASFDNNEDRADWLNTELAKTFKKDGYPDEWVDRLEKRRT